MSTSSSTMTQIEPATSGTAPADGFCVFKRKRTTPAASVAKPAEFDAKADAGIASNPVDTRTNVEHLEPVKGDGDTTTVMDAPADFGEDATFTDLGLGQFLVDGLRALSIRRPTAIQRACIPAVLRGVVS
jgi:hypothetical protein